MEYVRLTWLSSRGLLGKVLVEWRRICLILFSGDWRFNPICGGRSGCSLEEAPKSEVEVLLSAQIGIEISTQSFPLGHREFLSYVASRGKRKDL